MGDMADVAFDNYLNELNKDDIIEMARKVKKSIEARWKRGNHKTKDGRLLKISEMRMDHLCNTIKFFSHYNTKPLTDEIKKRLNK